MEEHAIFRRINGLANEAHKVWNKESRGEATDTDRERLRRIQMKLDQCWERLHRRLARKAAGLSPDGTRVQGRVVGGAMSGGHR